MIEQLRCLALKQEATRLSTALDFCQTSFSANSAAIRNVALWMRKQDFSLHAVSYRN